MRFSVAASIVSALSVSLVAAPSGAAPADPAISSPRAACVHQPPRGTPAGAARLAVADPAHGTRGDAVAQGIDRAIRSGEPLTAAARPASGLPYGLTQGVVGVLGSARTGFTVVVDERLLDEKRFRRQLARHLPPRSAGDVRLERSCRSSAELASAWQRLARRNWHPRARSIPFVTDLDVATEQITVGISPQTARSDIRSAAAQIDRNVIRIEASRSVRASRLNDTPSGGHWGAARIISPREVCSAGFSVVRRDNGARASVTAGHCGANGVRWRSGNHYYGTGARRYNYPSYDQQLLVGSAYGPKIWTDGSGDNEDVRTVKGAGDPAVGQSVCVSGSFTRSLCGIRVHSLNARYCDAEGCTTHVMRGTRSGGVVVRTGDSGGPVYSRPRSNAATIRGMIFAGTGCSSAGCTTIFAERYDSVAGHLGVRVLTG